MQVFSVPESLHHVVCSCIIFAFAHAIMNQSARMLPSPVSISDSNNDAHDEYGVKYDGYEKAMSSLSNQYVGIDQKSEFALEQIAKGMDFVARRLNPRRRDGKVRKKGGNIVKEKGEAGTQKVGNVSPKAKAARARHQHVRLIFCVNMCPLLSNMPGI